MFDGEPHSAVSSSGVVEMDSMLAEHGRVKFPNAAVLVTSDRREWSGVYAECRQHRAGELPAFTSSVTEITYAVQGVSSAKVIRSGFGKQQSTNVRAGMIWICPQGVHECETIITDHLPEILHIYFPEAAFQRLSADDGTPQVAPGSLKYATVPHDPLLTQLIVAIGNELKRETSAGRILVEGVTLALAARLAHSYSADAPNLHGKQRSVAHGLDPRRLQRVIDFIEANISADLSICDLARVACLSQFHFSRAFRIAMGTPPHRYLSERRLQHAKVLLSSGNLSIGAIAEICRFSSQSSFTRAFTQAVGASPARFRRSRSA